LGEFEISFQNNEFYKRFGDFQSDTKIQWFEAEIEYIPDYYETPVVYQEENENDVNDDPYRL
jgi:hypothetical protein